MNVAKIEKALTSATKKYTQMRKREERAQRRYSNRSYYMYSDRVQVREVAWEVMEAAYLKASANGTLPAKPRQIMYAARPHILAQCTQESFTSQYFTQTLLVDYVAEHHCDWDIVWDARGHLIEPHTDEKIEIGTLEVRDYLSRITMNGASRKEALFALQALDYPTKGPEHRSGALLYIEKEGFFPLFEKVRLAERWDIAIMSCKGMSVTAGRTLIDQLCGRYDIPLLILHDFDKSGCSIRGTLSRDNRRYTWEHDIKRIDLGLRLEDVEQYDLETEPVHHRAERHTVARNLRLNGATEAEIEFLLTRRVELNAFASDQFIEWLESKFEKHGIKKVVPDAETLGDAFRRAAQAKYLNAQLDELSTEAKDYADALKLPRGGLVKKVKSMLKESPEMSWDHAVATLAPEPEVT